MGHAVSAFRVSRPIPHSRESGRRTLTPRLTTRLHDQIAQTVSKAVTQAFSMAVDAHTVFKIIEEFEALYAGRPVWNNTGGSKYNDSLWLFVLARVYAPDLIVESGTYKGHSAWLLANAAPNADISTYDISHAELSHRVASVDYIEADWVTDDISVPPSQRALAFFDDHINHAQRLMEAADRGFETVLLDDNFPAPALYATGSPPVPTLDMIMSDDLPDGFELCWTKSGMQYQYVLDRQEITEARKRIAKSIKLPDLSAINHYRPQSGLSVVQLRV